MPRRRPRMETTAAADEAALPPWVEEGFEWIDPIFALALCVLAEMRGMPKTCPQRACRARNACTARDGLGPARPCRADFGGEDVEPLLQAMVRFMIVVQKRAQDAGVIVVPPPGLPVKYWPKAPAGPSVEGAAGCNKP